MQEKATAQRTTLSQKASAVAGLAMFPALTVMVFTRRKVGYRFLDPTRLMVMVLLLWVFAGITTLIPVGTTTLTSARNPYNGYQQNVTVPNGSATANLYPLIIFGLLVLVVGMIERYLRWRDIKNGVSWHTQSRGVSWFSKFIPLSDSNIKRFIDPLAVAIAGLLIMIPFRFLGYYIIFSAVCLFIFEAWDYEQQLNRMLDTLDSLVDSEVMSGNVDYYSRDGKAEQRPLDETAGIPTGIAPDIQRQIERRKARRPLPPDNLVATTPVTVTPPGTAF